MLLSNSVYILTDIKVHSQQYEDQHSADLDQAYLFKSTVDMCFSLQNDEYFRPRLFTRLDEDK